MGPISFSSGGLDKIGNFVDVKFEMLAMPRGSVLEYPGGKTFDVLLRDELPLLIDSITKDMQRLTPALRAAKAKAKSSRLRKWYWVAAGGVAAGVISSLIIGPDDKPSVGALPRPPDVSDQ